MSVKFLVVMVLVFRKKVVWERSRIYKRIRDERWRDEGVVRLEGGRGGEGER